MAKPKKPPLENQGNPVSVVSGAIAGMPSSLARASDELMDVIARANSVANMPGVLDERRAARIDGIATEIAGWTDDIHLMRLELDSMIAAGIGLPEKPPTTELDLV